MRREDRSARVGIERLRFPQWFFILAVALTGAVFLTAQAQAFNIEVEGPGGAAVGDFRFVIEEDTTYHHVPGVSDPDSLAFNFDASYMPVVLSGSSDVPAEATALGNLLLDPAKRYFVSVLPKTVGAFAMGGAPVAGTEPGVTIRLNSLPTPTAQISVLTFEDNNPISNVPDLPQERGLAGFKIELTEAGGRFGASGGLIEQDAFGNPLVNSALDGVDDPGQAATRGTIITNEFGVALIKNLTPAKYGVTVSPPTMPAGQEWHQTSTIEGTLTIDAWVKANEPPYFTEFGPAGHHCDFGFVQQMNGNQDRNGDGFPDLNGSATVSGQIASIHMSRPPLTTFYAGAAFPDTWVGLNDAAGVGIYARPVTGPDSSFTIPNVPPGTYTLKIWDNNLDAIFSSTSVVVNPGDTTVALGQIGIFDWFGHLEGKVFFDTDKDGFPDPTEPGLFNPNLAVNLRWRDGTIYQSTGVKPGGNYAFNEVFPFFSWLIAEVDFAQAFKATGATIVVDAGGEVTPHNGWINPSFGKLTPQIQPTSGLPYRTEAGEVLTQGIQTFLGQTNVIYWGKAAYDEPDIDFFPFGNFPTEDDGDIDVNGNGILEAESGGISGVVSYDTTRAENDPRFGFAENWQPGVPRVQVNLYKDANNDGVPDCRTAASCTEQAADPTSWRQADVDNYPFGWADGGAKGPEDINNIGGVNVFNQGDAVAITWTDSWDDSKPEGCPGADPIDPVTPLDKCYDGLRAFNQVRDAVFDGGYAFPGWNNDTREGILPGVYIVEAVPPAGYEIVRAQHKNVDFGEDYTPSPLALPPFCVGDAYGVPQYLDLFPNEVLHPYYDSGSTDYKQPWDPASPFELKHCDRKQVDLSAGQNAAADFLVFTGAPVSGHVKGFILNDLGNEFDPNNPNFGEKFAPPWVPIQFYDYNGNPVTRVYSDEFGTYNALVPSTFTTNIPSPSGMAPNMLIACMNDPGPILVNGEMDIDPNFKQQYTQFCYTFQYMPGATTYLDTPVLPIAAFAGQNQFPLDCEFPDLTPLIGTVSQPSNGAGGGPYALAGQVIRITSAGVRQVPNPAYVPGGAEPITITRNYNFGGAANPGTVQMTSASGTVINLPIVSWAPGLIRATVPAGTAAGAYNLTVTRVGGVPEPITSPIGVTLTVGPLQTGVVRPVAPAGAAYSTIQSAIDVANPGDLILVAPGTYEELVVMYRPVQLQGWGPFAVTINAVKRPGEKLQLWRNKVTAAINSGAADLLPGQELGFDPANNEPALLVNSEGPGILVLAKNTTPARGGFGPSPNARIDGLSITGADIGGAIVVNGYARYLEISNNRLFANEGHGGGGIQVGHGDILDGTVDAVNDFVHIHHNHISQNGSPIGSPGGIALYTGSDRYRIDNNHICGNFSTGSGGGIGHIGLSQNGTIEDNTIVFNQSFNQMPMEIGGAGIAIEGVQIPGALTPGAGNVDIFSNLIQGNQAGAGDGGGIRLAFVNGQDIEARPNQLNQWHRIQIYNNMIVNNMTGKSGGGISLQDATRVIINQNTIAHNDSTATVGELVDLALNGSTPQPGAGIVSRGHSPALAAVIGVAGGEFSDPVQLFNDIILHNRSFYWEIDPTAGTSIGSLVFDGYSDLAVIGAVGSMDPRSCYLTSEIGYHASNIDAAVFPNPGFVSAYFNGPNPFDIIAENTTPLTAAATDEGGNFIDVHFSPLSLVYPSASDYHLLADSPAVNIGRAINAAPAALDIDNDPRPQGARFDIGADEVVP